MKDRYFTALANDRRRDLLLSLREGRTSTVEIHPGRATTSLTHVHLPMLEDAGLVRWDREAGTISRGANYDDLDPVIATLQAESLTASD